MRVPEGDHGPREQGGADRGEGSDPEGARAQSREVGQLVLRGRQFALDPLPSLGQGASRVGERDAPRMPLQQGLSGLRFQTADLLGDR